jgi:DNA-binding transcriptional LysR family regulator
LTSELTVSSKGSPAADIHFALKMDTLRNMRTFVQVVESNSFTGAAHALNTTTASVSRGIAELEMHLRTRLLHRTTRRVALTNAGARYWERCERILAEIKEAEMEAAGALIRPAGTLRVHAPPTLAQYLVAPAIAKYKLRHSEVAVELTVGLDTPDLLADRFDVAVCVAARELQDSGLVRLRLGSSYSILCASAAYVDRRGMPTTLDDLAKHTCCDVVTPFFSAQRWSFDGPNGASVFRLPEDTFRVNNAEALAGALTEGIGIGALPIPNALASLENGSLVRVLPKYRLQLVRLFALYPSRTYLDAKMATWLQLLQTEVKQRLAANEIAIGRIRVA